MSPFKIQSLFSAHLGGENFGLYPSAYKFERLAQAKNEVIRARPEAELLDLGVGEPDDKAAAEVIETLYREAQKLETRVYPENGGPRLKQAAARYMQRIYGVSIDPQTQVIHCIGAKAALSILPAVFINPGDVALMSVPGYAVFGTHTRYCGGTVHQLPLFKQNNYLPDLDNIPSEILAKAKVLVLNYPNNPTGVCATPEFFKKAVEFAHQHNIAIVHDAAYGPLVFEKSPLSLLAIPGAMEVALEIHTTSKAFNMTGWRCGFVTGNRQLIAAYAEMKSNTDSGQFLAIQHAAAYAFDHPEITESIVGKYSRRMDALVKLLQASGFKVTKSDGTFFLYTPSPQAVEYHGSRIAFATAEDFSQWLLREHLISTVPWDDAGAYTRFSVTFQANSLEEERRFIDKLQERLKRFRCFF